MKFSVLLILLLIPSLSLFAQVETVPANHAVYEFLKKMQVAGILKSYDDIMIPISQSTINTAFLEIENRISELSDSERELFYKFKEKFSWINDDNLNIKDKSDNLLNYFFADKQKHLYSFSDSAISFYIDPIIENKYIAVNNFDSKSSLLNFGGIFKGTYKNFLGYYLQASNGMLFGNLDAAREDKRIEQSFSINDTKINFFDNTSGYVRFQNDNLSLQFGRERLLWGAGYLNRLVLSNNPQMFDFLRFNFHYKTLSYDFLHGWLVQKPLYVYMDSTNVSEKQKRSKYIAISRLGYTPTPELKLGISQIIIYSNRPFEAAYLNPFLFWESAQRSMNDYDNSFLSFDGRFKITDGVEVSASIILDDINFSTFGKWNAYNNSLVWQTGAYITYPMLFPNFSAEIEYSQNRPYMFSHPGFDEALTYTNNGYLLGINIQPNSSLFSFRLTYLVNEEIKMNASFEHLLRGKNIYDDDGKLLQNVGGNVFEYHTLYDSPQVALLAGNIERINLWTLNLEYEFLYGFYVNLGCKLNTMLFENDRNDRTVIWSSIKIDFE